MSMTKAGGGFVNMGDVFSMTSGDFSLVLWVKTAPGDQQEDLIPLSRHVSGHLNGYAIIMNISAGGAAGQIDKAYFYHSSAFGAEVISTTTVNDGAWHQIVAVYHAGGQVEIYVDGGQIEGSAAASPIQANSAVFQVGGITFGNTPTGV